MVSGDKTAVSASLSISLFFSGVLAPIVGILINKFGTSRIIVLGSLIAGTGFALLSTVSELWHLYFYMGIIATLGVSGMQLVPNFAMISRWFSKRRSTALGVATAGLVFLRRERCRGRRNRHGGGDPPPGY